MAEDTEAVVLAESFGVLTVNGKTYQWHGPDEFETVMREAFGSAIAKAVRPMAEQRAPAHFQKGGRIK